MLRWQSLGTLVAFQAMVSIATVGAYISYAIPIFIRITLAHRTFVPGPVHLGPRWCSLTVGWVAVVWVATITVLFCLPVSYPVTSLSLNIRENLDSPEGREGREALTA